MDENGDGRIERSVPDDRHIGVGIIEAVADANAVDVGELQTPLNAVVDPDALDRLFSERPDGRTRRGGEVTFEMADCLVTVEADRTVEVRDATRA